jgi:Chlorophyll A-B binding protein
MKIAVVASLVASATAFAPSQTSSRSSTAIKASFDSDVGRANDELGMWDPLNLVNGDQANFDRLRTAELKNGRVAMLAFLGYATTWGNPDYRFPGCADFPAGHEAVLKIPPIDLLLPIFAICAPLELIVFKQKEGSFPGTISLLSSF